MLPKINSKSEKYGLYVPIKNIGIKQGAAMVAVPSEAEMLLIYYEEPGYAQNVQTYEERVLHAADRLNEKYPTSKMTGAYKCDVKRVGTVSYRENMSWIISEITDHEAIIQWTGKKSYIGGTPEQRYKEQFNQMIKSENMWKIPLHYPQKGK